MTLFLSHILRDTTSFLSLLSRLLTHMNILSFSRSHSLSLLLLTSFSLSDSYTLSFSLSFSYSPLKFALSLFFALSLQEERAALAKMTFFLQIRCIQMIQLLQRTTRLLNGKHVRKIRTDLNFKQKIQSLYHDLNPTTFRLVLSCICISD